MDDISLNGKRILIVFDDFFGGAGNMAQLLGMYLSEKKTWKSFSFQQTSTLHLDMI